uniref:Uncharacterized protein n=1 Tax=Setaria italica TaxID=4555 RepID=K4A3K0_SETIT
MIYGSSSSDWSLTESKKFDLAIAFLVTSWKVAVAFLGP